MLKLGVVSYLNSLPLWTPLQHDANIHIVRDVPSQLQQKLRSGEVDVALMPVVDYLRGGGTIVSDAIIGADGPVRSVLLLSRVPLQEIRSIAADTSSHSSVALLEILLREHLQVLAPLHPHPPDVETMLQAHDAALIIGDLALEAAQNVGENVIIYDLAQAWRELTGLAFVFAAWIARDDISECAAGEWGELLSRSRDIGRTQIPQLAREYANEKLAAPVIESYLRDAINHTLTERHRAGLDEFARRLKT